MNKLLFALFAVAFLVFQAAAALPDNYDTRKQYPNCITPILDQGNCGSCWAHSVVESMTERFCIHSQAKLTPSISAQYLTSCDTNSAGCGGGDTVGAYAFILKNGNDDANCTQYTSGHTQQTGKCPTTCDDKTTPISKDNLFFASKSYSLSTGDAQKNVEVMMQEIVDNGPISASFIVRRDFIDFFKANKTGIYRSTGGAMLGGHAIKVIGFGVDNGIKYWQCVNSWSNTWGDSGYFKIVRGQDDCAIESRRLSAGIPLLPHAKVPEYAVPLDQVKDVVVDGGFMKQPVVDEEMVKIATKAVSKLNAVNGDAVEIVEVAEAYTQVANGINYKFSLKARRGNSNAVFTSTVQAHVDVVTDAVRLVAFY